MTFAQPADRLIVAADFKPESPRPIDWVRTQVLHLADCVSETNVYIKVNSALRAVGYGLIDELHARGLRVFADLKLYDISETLKTDGMLLRSVTPELVTVACPTGLAAMRALRQELPQTEVLGVGVLTTFDDDDSKAVFTVSTVEAQLRLTRLASDADLGGLVSSPAEAEMLRARFGIKMTLNTPAIRPEWTFVENDDQNRARAMTPAKAIIAGADRIVVGRPITQHARPREAVMRTLEEIAEASRHTQ